MEAASGERRMWKSPEAVTPKVNLSCAESFLLLMIWTESSSLVLRFYRTSNHALQTVYVTTKVIVAMAVN